MWNPHHLQRIFPGPEQKEMQDPYSKSFSSSSIQCLLLRSTRGSDIDTVNVKHTAPTFQTETGGCTFVLLKCSSQQYYLITQRIPEMSLWLGRQVGRSACGYVMSVRRAFVPNVTTTLHCVIITSNRTVSSARPISEICVRGVQLKNLLFNTEYPSICISVSSVRATQFW